MNKVVLMGRLTRNPEIRYSQGEKSTCVARYTLAVNRRIKREGEADADFINCVAFGKNGEFAEKYFKQGTKIVICGRIQTGSYTNRDGNKVYTTDIVIEEQDFAESKAASERNNKGSQPQVQQPAQQPASYQQPGYQQPGGYGYQQQSFGGYSQPGPMNGLGADEGFMVADDNDLPFI